MDSLFVFPPKNRWENAVGLPFPVTMCIFLMHEVMLFIHVKQTNVELDCYQLIQVYLEEGCRAARIRKFYFEGSFPCAF
jgi:hypothetical protein